MPNPRSNSLLTAYGCAWPHAELMIVSPWVEWAAVAYAAAYLLLSIVPLVDVTKTRSAILHCFDSGSARAHLPCVCVCV
jgi:hypothetical protein